MVEVQSDTIWQGLSTPVIPNMARPDGLLKYLTVILKICQPIVFSTCVPFMTDQQVLGNSDFTPDWVLSPGQHNMHEWWRYSSYSQFHLFCRTSIQGSTTFCDWVHKILCLTNLDYLWVHTQSPVIRSPQYLCILTQVIKLSNMPQLQLTVEC